MKKSANCAFRKALMLCVAALFCFSTVFATDYNLKVAGQKVTSDNCNDILNDGGSVKYDATANTLTLNNTTINAPTDEHGILNKIDGLKIVVTGTNTILTESDVLAMSPIYTAQACSVVSGGPGAVINAGTNGSHYTYGLEVSTNVTMTIDGGAYDLTINLTNPMSAGLYGFEMGSYVFRKANINITNSDEFLKGAVYGVKNLTLENCSLAASEGVSFETSKMAVVDKNGDVWKSNLMIVEKETNFSVFVKGNPVTTQNWSDVLNDGGSVTYDYVKKILTLNNANITCDDDAINFYEPGMTLKLIGKNTIDVTGSTSYGLSAEDGLKIMGPGKLTVTSQSTGIYADNLELSKGCKVTVLASQYGITCVGGELSVDASTLMVKGGVVSILNANTFIMKDAFFVSSTQYDEATHKFMDMTTSFESNDYVYILRDIDFNEYWNFKNSISYADGSDAIQSFQGVGKTSHPSTWAVRYPACYLKGREEIKEVVFATHDAVEHKVMLKQSAPGADAPDDKALWEQTITGEEYDIVSVCPNYTIDPEKDLWVVISTEEGTYHWYVLEEMRGTDSYIYKDGKWQNFWEAYQVDLTHAIALKTACEVRKFPYVCGFESGSSEGWTSVDADGDGYNWQVNYSTDNAHNGKFSVTSASFTNSTILHPDNWLISPAIAMPAKAKLSWWEKQRDWTTAYPEKRAVYISTGNTPADFKATTPVYEAYDLTSTHVQETVELGDKYAGQMVYIAFRHFDCSDGFYLVIDDIIVDGDCSAVETVDNAQCTMHKYIRDGQVYIVRDGKTYNVLGTAVE